MTPDERRTLLAIVDRRMAAIDPTADPHGLADQADDVTDADVVGFLASWLEEVLETFDHTLGLANVQAELLKLQAARRTLKANTTRRVRRDGKAEQARELRANGRSIAKIAEALKVGPRTVERYLQEKIPPV